LNKPADGCTRRPNGHGGCAAPNYECRVRRAGEEPPDILNYAANHPRSPHDTTADQFFDEDQFETYRALGYHIGGDLFGALRGEAEKEGAMDAAMFFAQVAALATRTGDEPGAGSDSAGAPAPERPDRRPRPASGIIAFLQYKHPTP
jgi:hypothetical protein